LTTSPRARCSSACSPAGRSPRGPSRSPAWAALGPLGQYDAIAARPLFATDRRPHPFVLRAENGEPTDAPAFDLVLTSVLITPQANIAIVQKPDGSASWRVRVGDAPEAFPNWRLASIAPRSATFAGPEGEKTLELRVYGGAPSAGGPGPTPPTVETPGPVPTPVPAPPPPPPTDASAAPDPEQIEAIRRRIEARREQMRQRAQTANPPSTATPAPPTR
jgi:general secretion pathway protein N